MRSYAIYRESRRPRGPVWREAPRPRRMGMVEAKSEKEALSKFAVLEQRRSRQVQGWHVTKGRLVITLMNGRNAHEAVYWAARQEGERA